MVIFFIIGMSNSKAQGPLGPCVDVQTTVYGPSFVDIYQSALFSTDLVCDALEYQWWISDASGHLAAFQTAGPVFEWKYPYVRYPGVCGYEITIALRVKVDEGSLGQDPSYFTDWVYKTFNVGCHDW